MTPAADVSYCALSGKLEMMQMLGGRPMQHIPV
jgi:hypothetical protein